MRLHFSPAYPGLHPRLDLLENVACRPARDGHGPRELTGLDHAPQGGPGHSEHPQNLLALAEGLRKAGRESESRAACERALALARGRRNDPDASEWEEEAESALRDLP